MPSYVCDSSTIFRTMASRMSCPTFSCCSFNSSSSSSAKCGRDDCSMYLRRRRICCGEHSASCSMLRSRPAAMRSTASVSPLSCGLVSSTLCSNSAVSLSRELISASWRLSRCSRAWLSTSNSRFSDLRARCCSCRSAHSASISSASLSAMTTLSIRSALIRPRSKLSRVSWYSTSSNRLSCCFRHTVRSAIRARTCRLLAESSARARSRFFSRFTNSASS
mmetsp:Transcript_18947/g.45387  ORF Transcript_18947/g.45387 Transcript_18947/m.45387 type:complete len:221 (-) Transcript_18947:836-1498(-)